MKILEFQTYSDAETVNQIISQLGIALHSQNGWQVDSKGIVPVSKKTGESRLSGAHLEKWAIPKQPIKEEYDVWYIPDPREYYPDYSDIITSYMSESGVSYIAKDWPSEWDYSMEELKELGLGGSNAI